MHLRHSNEVAAMNTRSDQADAAVAETQDDLLDAKVASKENAQALINVLQGYVGS